MKYGEIISIVFMISKRLIFKRKNDLTSNNTKTSFLRASVKLKEFLINLAIKPIIIIKYSKCPYKALSIVWASSNVRSHSLAEPHCAQVVWSDCFLAHESVGRSAMLIAHITQLIYTPHTTRPSVPCPLCVNHSRCERVSGSETVTGCVVVTGRRSSQSARTSQGARPSQEVRSSQSARPS